MSQESKIELVQSQPPSDELARTAGMLLEQVKHEQNPKFKNSQFMGLMKQLRDGRITVDGNQLVESDGMPVSQIDMKGKGRAIDDTGLSQSGFAQMPTSQMSFINDPSSSTDSLQDSTTRQEDANDAYFRQENEDYIRYWSEKNARTISNTTTSGFEAEWDKLQADWDRFEATATGIREVDMYQFQSSNPYLLGDSSCLQMDRQSIIEVCPLLQPFLDVNRRS